MALNCNRSTKLTCRYEAQRNSGGVQRFVRFCCYVPQLWLHLPFWVLFWHTCVPRTVVPAESVYLWPILSSPPQFTLVYNWFGRLEIDCIHQCNRNHMSVVPKVKCAHFISSIAVFTDSEAIADELNPFTISNIARTSSFNIIGIAKKITG